MERSLAGAPVLLALLACVSLWCLVTCDHEQGRSDYITFERERIFVNFEDGPTFSVMVEPNETVQGLMDHIIDHENVPEDLTWLQLNETRLNFKAKLSDYKIQDGSTVLLLLSPNAHHTTQFKVRTREGREVSLSALHDTTVASLKDNITQLTGIPQVEQRLLLSGKELKDDRKLFSYNIFKTYTLNLGRPLEECRQSVTIFVKTLSDATIQVEVSLADTVNGLKEKIWESTGVPIAVQRLFGNYGALIIGEDHLCDLKLQAGSIVHMYLYSSRIVSLDQVARLRTDQPVAHSINPDEGPIFREVYDESSARACYLFQDARNWIARSSIRQFRCYGLFNSVAYLSPYPDFDIIKHSQQTLQDLSSSNATEGQRREAVILRARIKLTLAVMPYFMSQNFTSLKRSERYRGITTGGGFTHESPEQPVPLGADVNNWAPDAFTDSDLMRLFELRERVRQVLASNLHTRVGVLSIANQRRINRGILFSYLVALGGYPPAIKYIQEGEGDECRVCRDDLTVESNMRLPCGHAFHYDCIISWVSELYKLERSTTCPYCKQGFLFPYEDLGKAELGSTELQDSLDNL